MSGDAPSGYREIRELGRGASGRVVLAVHDDTGTQVAVKHLDGALFADDGFLRDFRAEARILAELDDPWIVRLYEYVETPSGAAVVMVTHDRAAARYGSRELHLVDGRANAVDAATPIAEL